MLKREKNSMENLYGENFEAVQLSWDTEYFGVLSARVTLKNGLAEDEYVELINFLNEYEFVTINNLDNSSKNNQWVGKCKNTFLTDVNVQFIKSISDVVPVRTGDMEVYEAYSYDEEIVKIATEAFKYSRFFNDPFLPSDKARSIYIHWLNSAFGKRGRYFVIARQPQGTAGFLLFSINNETSTATIELIAVDNKFKGKKLGKSLIDSMVNFVSNKNIEIIKVGTQVNNINAINFYNACGFKNISCSSIYHYWPKK